MLSNAGLPRSGIGSCCGSMRTNPPATLMGPHSSEWRLGHFLTRLANPSVCPADWRSSCLFSTSHPASSQTLSYPSPTQHSPPTCDYKKPPAPVSVEHTPAIYQAAILWAFPNTGADLVGLTSAKMGPHF